MVAGVYAELGRKQPRRRFTIGIDDDVSGSSINYDRSFDIESPDTVRAIFFGLGSDGTVSANKNTIKILGVRRRAARPGVLRLRLEEIGFANRVASPLRAGSHPRPLPRDCRQFHWMPSVPVPRQSRCAGSSRPRSGAAAELPASGWRKSGTLCPDRSRNRSWPSGSRCTPSTPTGSLAKPGSQGGSTSSCRHAFSRSRTCCPPSRRSPESRIQWRRRMQAAAPTCCAKELVAVDAALNGLHRIEVPAVVTSTRTPPPTVPESAPQFVRKVTAEMMAGRGNALPVSALPVDGTYPSGTTAYEKRNISELVAVWDAGSCIQCGNCSFVCPHSVIRSKYYDQSQLAGAPDQFDSAQLDAVGPPERQVLAAGVRRGLHRLRPLRRGLSGRDTG